MLSVQGSFLFHFATAILPYMQTQLCSSNKKLFMYLNLLVFFFFLTGDRQSKLTGCISQNALWFPAEVTVTMKVL